MNMNRKLVKKINMGEEIDDGHVQAEKNELISMIWEITKDNWAFVRGQDVKRRLMGSHMKTLIKIKLLLKLKA
ncbi:MAG: hypothetical protein JRJ82_03045 [Deltaproteobacteria bacterium]|nr:hypothetical protein [Deltaproteobacteria bacterium]